MKTYSYKLEVELDTTSYFVLFNQFPARSVGHKHAHNRIGLDVLGSNGPSKRKCNIRELKKLLFAIISLGIHEEVESFHLLEGVHKAFGLHVLVSNVQQHLLARHVHP